MNPGTLGRTSATISAALLGFVWGASLVPRLSCEPRPLGLLLTLTLAIACALLCLLMLGRKSEGDASTLLKFRECWPALLAPAIGTSLLAIGWVRSHGFPVWAMNGDMVWNTAQSLFVHQDGGVVPSVHPNPAPLTNTLFALAYGQAADPSLGTVFVAHATVLLVLAVLAAVLSGLYVALRASGLNPLVRVGLTFGVSWIPYTGALFGAVTEFGHANVLTSYLVLWLAWIVYAERTIPRVMRVSLLLILTTVTVATWAPLAVVPIALALVGFVDMLRERAQASELHARVKPWQWLVLVLGAVQLSVYGLLVTLPDLNREGAALGQDGSGLAFTPQAATTTFVALGISAFVTWWLARRSQNCGDVETVSRGALSVLVLSMPALAYLLLQRQGMTYLWGYYPAKFVSILALVSVGVMIASIAAVTPRRFGVFRQLIPVAVCVVLFALPTLGPFGWAPGMRSLAPGVHLAIQPTDAKKLEPLRALVEIYDERPGQASLLLDHDLWGELMVNGYLIQLSTERSTDPVRAYAYVGDHLNAAQLCDLLVVWGDRDVKVYLGDVGPVRVDQLESCDAENLLIAAAPRS